MPPGWNQINALLAAAAFTPAELEVLCQSVFGTALSGITSSADPDVQSDAIVSFAIKYGMLRELTDMVLHESARRPAVQNLLLSDDMQQGGDGQTTINNQLQILTMRVDRVLELQMSQAAENSEMQRWRNATDQRLRSVENAQALREKQSSFSMLDRAAVLAIALAAIAMMAFVIFWAKP